MTGHKCLSVFPQNNKPKLGKRVIIEEKEEECPPHGYHETTDEEYKWCDELENYLGTL